MPGEGEDREQSTLLENLTATQTRCTELLEESRDLRELVRMLSDAIDDVLGIFSFSARHREALCRGEAIVHNGVRGDRCGQCGRVWDDLAALVAKCSNAHRHLEAIKQRTSRVKTECLCKVENGERFAHPLCHAMHELSAVGHLLPDGSIHRGSPYSRQEGLIG